MKKIFYGLMVAAMMLLTGCASTLRSDVTSFQRWPANAAGSTYSFKRMGNQEGSLEHKTYEDLARAEMNKLGLKEAAAGTKGRFDISLDYGVNTRTQRSSVPVYNNAGYWYPSYYHPTLGWRPGYWAADPWGPQVVGYRTVSRDVSTRRLRVDIAEGVNKVFEASATSSGSNATLTVTMPYLIRSVFDGFPGTNGQSRAVEFDVDKDAVKSRSVAQPN